MSMNELDSKVAEYRELLAMQEEIAAQIETIKDAIKARMVEDGSEILKGSDWTARWVNVNSARFDTKKFKAEHPEIYSTFCKASTTTRFTLSA